MNSKEAIKGKGGYLVSMKKSYVRFDGNGMSVDMARYLSTPEGQKRFKDVASSAFRPRPSTGTAGKK